MAKFQPGQSGNPSGLPNKPKVLNRQEIEVAITDLARMPKDQLMEVATNPKTPMLKIMLASIMVKAAQHGDSARMNFLLDRTVGRVVEKLELTKAEPYVIQKLDGSTLEIGANPPKEKDGDAS